MSWNLASHKEAFSARLYLIHFWKELPQLLPSPLHLTIYADDIFGFLPNRYAVCTLPWSLTNENVSPGESNRNTTHKTGVSSVHHAEDTSLDLILSYKDMLLQELSVTASLELC